MSPILEFRQATKAFRGIPAIKNIDFTLSTGEIHAVVGESGAGKSTLMKVLAGVYELTSGELIFDGKPLHLKSPAEALAQGIAMVFQETNLVPSMSVAQNIYLGEEQLFNRLRGLYIQAQRPEFLCRPDGARLDARRGQKANGGDCPRGPPPCPGADFRRADRESDAGREVPLLQPRPQAPA
jgi:ABC-type uncharacterized transport system ATPase subunit